MPHSGSHRQAPTTVSPEVVAVPVHVHSGPSGHDLRRRPRQRPGVRGRAPEAGPRPGGRPDRGRRGRPWPPRSPPRAGGRARPPARRTGWRRRGGRRRRRRRSRRIGRARPGLTTAAIWAGSMRKANTAMAVPAASRTGTSMKAIGVLAKRCLRVGGRKVACPARARAAASATARTVRSPIRSSTMRATMSPARIEDEVPRASLARHDRGEDRAQAGLGGRGLQGRRRRRPSGVTAASSSAISSRTRGSATRTSARLGLRRQPTVERRRRPRRASSPWRRPRGGAARTRSSDRPRGRRRRRREGRAGATPTREDSARGATDQFATFW